MNSANPAEPNDPLYTGDAFQAFFKGSPQSVLVKANSPHFTVLAVSDRFLEISMRSRADLLGKDLFDIFLDHTKDPWGKDSALRALTEVIKTKRKVELPIYKYDVYSSDTGKMEPLYWSNSNEPVFNHLGEVSHIVNTTSNITAEVMMKEMAASSEHNISLQQQRLNKMFLKAPIGMALFSKGDFIIEYANEAMCKMWDIGPPDQVTGHSVFELIPSIEASGFKEIYNRVVNTGHAFVAKESPVTYNRSGVMQTAYFDLHFEPIYGIRKEITGMLSLANEVTDQVSIRKTIENAEERLRLASEATGIGSWDLDLQTREIIYSPRLADLFGLPGKTDIRHQELRELIHPEDKQIVEQAFKVALISGIYSYKARIIRPDKVIYWISVTGKVLFDKHGQAVRMLGTVMDITESKFEEIQKNDFIAIASHELKTPLTSLKAYAQLLKTGRGVEDGVFVSSVAGRIEGQINKMTKLVYSFLDLSKIESNKTELIREQVDLNQVIRDVATEYLFQEKNHPVSFEAEVLPLIYADRNKISQVIDNLISNAIKYSPNGGVIMVTAKAADDQVMVAVEDHGIGIDSNHTQRIFDRFYRVDDLQVKNASGFGIGLYLCADIIKRHNGQIGLHSEPGKGSVFYFSLPVGSSAEAETLQQ